MGHVPKKDALKYILLLNVVLKKRLQVAYTFAHVYMWAPVPQGSQ